MQKGSGIPLYMQIKQWIAGQVASGDFAEGARIPGEHELSKTLNVSRGTVREAIRELIEEGTLYTIHGRGTFVKKVEQATWSVSTLVSVADSFDAAKIEHSTKVIEISKSLPDASVAAKLNIESNTEVIRLERLRFIDGEPVHLSRSFLPATIAEKLMDIDLTDKSLYQVMEDALGVRVSRVDRKVMARLADPFEVSMLKLPDVAAILVLDGIAYNEFEKPVECSIARFPTERSRFLIESRRVN